MKPDESKKFLRILGFLSLGWLGLGLVLSKGSADQAMAFIEIYLYATLDLVFLILLFWKIFFSHPSDPGRKFQIVIFLTFKLVCLGFLAITLKRLRNASLTAILMGIGFVFMGPFLASLIKIICKGKRT